MSKESPPKKTRSIKKVTEGSNTAELEAKIAQLEAKLANLSSQVKPAEQKPAQTSPKPQPRPAASGPTHGTLPAGMKPAEAPKPEPKPQPRPAASGPTHGTLPAGMKPAESPKPQSAPDTSSVHEPSAGEVAPAYAKISSTGYTGNKYFATRKRLSYHPSDKQFTGNVSTTSTVTTTAPPQPAPEPKHESQTSTSRGTLPAGTKPQEKKSLWKAKGSDVAETYVAEEEPKPQPRPAASGPTHGTLPAGMKPVEAPKPQSAPDTSSVHEPSAGEVAPAYAKISSTGYTGNKYFATRKRLSYHPSDKQFTGNVSTTSTVTTTAPPQPAPEPKHESQTSTSRGTLPAGTKPQEKKSLWKAKGSDVAETYVAEEEPKPQPRPAASGPTHGTLPVGMKPAEAPKPQSAPDTSSVHEPSAGEVAPAYAKISSTGYTGNKYFATRKRLSYHPSDKQFTGNVSTTSTVTTTAPPPPAPEPKHESQTSTSRGTLPAGTKPQEKKSLWKAKG